MGRLRGVTWSSETRAPDFMVASSDEPSSEPFLTSALSRSPVLRCLKPPP